MQTAIVKMRAAGIPDSSIGEAMRDVLEKIEVYSINVELLNFKGTFKDPAWIERRSLAARTRLEATTDPLLLPGYRKIVRKWNEEIRHWEVFVRVESRIALGHFAAADAAWLEFVEWMKRPDRKAFDETG